MATYTQFGRFACLTTGLLAAMMFFFPLLSVDLPFVGHQEFSGYDALSRFPRFVDRISSEIGGPIDSNVPTRAELAPTQPISFELAWLIPIWITGALLCSLLVVICSVIESGGTRLVGIIGTLLGVMAILHLQILNSDVHTMISNAAIQSSQSLQGNPYANASNLLGARLVNSVRLRPGTGLYVLAASLCGAALLTYFFNEDWETGGIALSEYKNSRSDTGGGAISAFGRFPRPRGPRM